jgi:site-specific recombinase XerD
MSAATLSTRLVSLYAFIRFLADEGVMSRQLLKRKIHIKLPIKLPKSIEADDEDRILAQIDKVRDKAMILLLLRTGMRIGELLKTTMQDISLEGQLIRIYESEKTGTGRVVYFGNDAAEALYQWLMKRDYWKKHLFHGPRDKAISYEAARAIFKKYVDKAGLSHKGISLHCLRHTYATGLLNAGMHIEVLRDLLGHHSLEQTRRYAREEKQMNMTTAIIEYRRHLKRRSFSSHTLINYMSSIKLFVLWLDIPVQTVTYQHICAYIDYLLDNGLCPQSINSNLYRIRGFYDFLHYEKGLPIENPVKERCGLRLPKPLPRYLRDTDTEKFFSVINKKRDLAMFKIMLRCGLRLEETANLTI